MYLDSTEATGSQPHVMEGQSDGEGVTKLNHGASATETARRSWRNEDHCNEGYDMA